MSSIDGGTTHRPEDRTGASISRGQPINRPQE
jgi:hypothetical protein